MNTEKSKPSETSTDVGKIVVSQKASRWRLSNKIRTSGGSSRSPKIGKKSGALIIVVIVLLGAGVFAMFQQKDVANNARDVLTVRGDGKEFSLSETQYEALIEQAKQQRVPANVAKETIIKAYKYKIAAPSLKIEPSKEKVSAAARAGAGYSGNGPMNDWQQLYGYAAAVEGNIKLAQTGGYTGAMFIYPFDKVYYNDNFKYGFPSRGAVEVAKKSALAEASADRSSLLAGKTTANKLIDKIRQDINRTWVGGSNSSKLFEINTDGVTYVADDVVSTIQPDYIMNAIKSLDNKPGVSEIVEIIEKPYGASNPEMMGYAYVSVTDIFAANQNIENDLKQILNTIEVVDHVN